MSTAADGLLTVPKGRTFGAILADPPWQFQSKTGKIASACDLN